MSEVDTWEFAKADVAGRKILPVMLKVFEAALVRPVEATDKV